MSDHTKMIIEITIMLLVSIGIVGGAIILMKKIAQQQSIELQAKHECETTLPRNIECIWSKPEGFEE